MKETVADRAHREATADMANKEADMVTRDMVNSKVDEDTVGNKVVMVNKDTAGNRAGKDMADSKADGDNMKIMANSVDMANKIMEDSKVDGVNKVDKDMEVNKADGDNTKGMVNSVDTANRSTADMDKNMKANMVKTETMAEADMMKRKMNPGCRDVTGVGKKKIMMKNMMKMRMRTIMECKVGMERKMNMMKTKMKMITSKCRGVRVADLAVCQTNRNIAWVASIGTTNVMIREGGDNHPAVLPGMDQITDHLVLLHVGTGNPAVPAEAVPTLPAVVLPVCRKMKYAA